jgi:hypothetical protein
MLNMTKLKLANFLPAIAVIIIISLLMLSI